MPNQTFAYRGIDAKGGRRSGTVMAASESAACQAVMEQGITPITVKPRSRQLSIGRSGSKVTQHDVAALTREMSVLVEANIPIARGLRSIAEHERKASLRDMVNDIADQVESGEKLTTAFGKHRAVFSDVYIETIRAAEKSGTLAEVTSHLADMLERNIETSSQLRRAMTYPLIVIAFVIIALTVIVVFVVPRFAVIFETNNVALPAATRIVTVIGEFVKAYWWVIGTGIVLGAWSFAQSWKSKAGRYRIEMVALNLPYLGRMIAAITAARFARVLSIGLDSGIDVIESMTVAGNATGRPVFARECTELCDRMRAGESMESVLVDSRRLPSFARRLLGAGKDAAELSAAGRIIARHYDRISDHLAKNINTIIEPIITIAIAGIV
ncbi:MAG: type II secretion system F family protein, partial [Planctomycetota bacterium]